MTQRAPSRSHAEAYSRRIEETARAAAVRAQAIGWDDVREAGLKADTAVRTAANLVTAGGADHVAAGLDALIEPGGLEHWDDRYRANLAQERARNQYDAVHRQAARVVGQIGGAALGMGAMGSMQGALALAPRLPGAAAMTAREAAAMLGAGAATGAGVQAVGSLMRGSPSSAGDYAGAAIGGAAGVAALPMNPARAGAVGAGVTAAAQDIFNGRTPDVGEVSENALLGYLFGGTIGGLGRRGSNGLTRAQKGRLGEGVGALRSRVNGLPREYGPKKLEKIEGKNVRWEPDGRSGDIRFEDKFGPYARLSPNQRLAREVLGDNFKLYHTLPADIGKALGMPAAAVASQTTQRGER